MMAKAKALASPKKPRNRKVVVVKRIVEGKQDNASPSKPVVGPRLFRRTSDEAAERAVAFPLVCSFGC